MSRQPAGVVLRRAAPEDTQACHNVMWHAITDLARRHGAPMQGSAEDWWPGSAWQFTYLSHAAAEWWVAEDEGGVVGSARSLERGGLLELSEFFVHPGLQTRGVGRAPGARAFPPGRGEVRSIIATTDVRALGRYHAADSVARFPILTLTRTPARPTGPGETAWRVTDLTSALLRGVQA